MRPLINAGHGFHRMARGVNRELMGGVLDDASHCPTKQVRQLPNRFSLCGSDDHIHINPRVLRERTVPNNCRAKRQSSAT